MTRQAVRRVPFVGAWRTATPVQRIVWYLQWSVYFLPFTVPLALLLGSLSSGRAVPAGVAALIAACAVHVVHRRSLVAQPPPLAECWRPLLVCVVGCVCVVVFGFLATGDREARAALIWLAGMLLVLAVAPTVSWSVGLALVAADAAAVAWFAAVGQVTFYAALMLIMFGTVKSTVWMLRVIADLDRARRTEAALSVAEERLRFSRDVHDVIGRSLSTIAVKSELAARLSERGDARAAAQMLDVRHLAHDALREARELARGYRESNLGAELDGARSLLEHAGIACDIDGGVAALAEDRREPAAWVVRESVTNVIRHSEASRVTVTIRPDAVTVVNDGARGAPAADGTGLTSLRERLAVVGATLTTTCADETFTVTAQFEDGT